VLDVKPNEGNPVFNDIAPEHTMANDRRNEGPWTTARREKGKIKAPAMNAASH
jgi:hypothetical protein